jgi:hypothetical protein
MSSLQTRTRQIPSNSGYYITLANVVTSAFTGTDSAPVLTALAASSTIGTASTLRDLGKTVVSSGRVFRKVQLLRNTSSIQVGGTDGVGGSDSGAGTTAYFTSYIELPGSGNFTSGVLAGSTAGQVSAVARLG